jgi:hypothetical protein
MTQKKILSTEFRQAMRAMALRYPEAEEGIACKGTALECSAFKAQNKTFLFMGTAELTLNLQGSLPEADGLAAKEPSRYSAAPIGWVTVRFSPDGSPPLELLEKWIDESYRLLAPKRLVALLPGEASPAGDSTKAAATKVPKKQKRKNS